MKKLLIASVISLCLPTAAQADALGLRIGANAWQQNFSGDAKSGQGAPKIDIEDDLGFDDDDGFQGYISFEHPIPIIPNILVQRTVIDADSNGNIDARFDGIDFNGPVQSTIDLTHTDATLYYEILDNWISLDIGLTARFFEEGFKIQSDTDGSASLDIDEVIPMVYAAIKFDLPLTGLYVGADGNGIKYDDDTILDLKAMLGWESSIGLGIEVGYRYFDVQYEDSQEEADVTIEGPYAGLFFHF
jgi:outer membrane protein